MALDIKAVMAAANEATAKARAEEFQKRQINDTLREALDALEEGDIYGLVKIIRHAATVSSLARALENNVLGQGTFMPKYVRSIGQQACAANGSTEYSEGSLKDLLDIDQALEHTGLADAAVAFWGGLHEVIKGRKLRRQLESVGGEMLLAKALATAVPDWAKVQPLSGINAHFANKLNEWFGLGLQIKELDYFGTEYSPADYQVPDYSELEEARYGSLEHQQDEQQYDLTIG